VKNCIFCKIVSGEIPAQSIYEDEHTIAFRDINPQAPHHILVIPREHYAHIHEIPVHNAGIFQQLLAAVSSVVTREGLTRDGYRLVINSGANSGQEVPHIHVHILAGRKMHWPPG
jgi:histidine triad (HIT) family protein